MNGFDLAGRPIRVGLGNDKFTAETTERVLQKFPQHGGRQEASSIFGAGGRGTHAGGNERFGGSSSHVKDQGQGHDGAIDNEGGVAMTAARREELMRNLLTREDPSAAAAAKNGAASVKAPIVAAPRREAPPNVPQASRCIKLHNVFDAAE
jgi:RNA-binding protein 39